MQMSTAPIGIYDSGLGGLSVVRQLQRRLPQESFVYVADTARVPYGGRSEQEIHQFSAQIVDFLWQYGVKTILCACNTSSVVILPEMRDYRGVRVLGLAQAGARSPQGFKRVAVLATEATVRSGLYRRLIGMRYPEIELQELACPEFVPLVEAGAWDGPEVEAVVARRLASLQESRPDAVILGCSHYPYLAPVLRRVLGPEVPLLDPAEEMVGQLARRLERGHLQTPYGQSHAARFYATGPVTAFRPLAEAYLQMELPRLEQTDLSPLPTLALSGQS